MRLRWFGLTLPTMSVSVVTGSNRGIGLALCRALKERGKTVVAGCRKPSPELLELGVEVVSGVDVQKAEGAAILQRKVGERPVELLINNAGILVWGDNAERVDFEGALRQFDVNALGPIRVTQALSSRLQEGAKLAFITSRMGSVADNTSGGHYGYRMSKAALNIAAVSFARDLAARKIAVAVLHPGMVSTDMIGGNGQIDAQESAAGLLARIDDLTVASSGKFWHQNGQELPW